MKTFEDTNVLYMLNQARMPFAQIVMYPLYKIENGRVVVDDSDYSKNLKRECAEIDAMLTKWSKRLKTDVMIPKTWGKRILEQETLIIALKQGGNICDEWFNEFNRLLRYVRNEND